MYYLTVEDKQHGSRRWFADLRCTNNQV